MSRFTIRSVDDALCLADEWGLAVAWGPLTGRGASDRRYGEYCHALQQITLRPGMTSKQVLCTLTHELAHAYYGDRTTTASIEARAWEWAARALIDAEEYARAEAIVGPHPGALAVELGVTVPAIIAYQRCEKIDPTSH